MTRDPLEALLRLRRMTVDKARRDLADCLRIEAEAEKLLADIESAIARETAVATDLASGDAEVEAFAAWLRGVRPRQRAAREAETMASADTAEARTVLAMARAAERAVEEVLARHELAEHAAAEHQGQHEIDEAAQLTSSRQQNSRGAH